MKSLAAFACGDSEYCRRVLGMCSGMLSLGVLDWCKSVGLWWKGARNWSLLAVVFNIFTPICAEQALNWLPVPLLILLRLCNTGQFVY